MVGLNTSHANLRTLSNEKYSANEKCNEAWLHLQSLAKIYQPKIDMLVAKRARISNQINERFGLSKLAYSRNNHKAAKKFSKAAKKCIHSIVDIDKKHCALMNILKIAREKNKIAAEHYRVIKAKFSQAHQSCISKRSQVAIMANISEKYKDNVSIIEYKNGAMNIYFGGKGTPSGPGHGHICVDPNGIVRYMRNPWDKHGSHNYTKRDNRPEKNNSC